MKMKLKNLFSLIGLLFQLQSLQFRFFFVFLFFFSMETLRAENVITIGSDSYVIDFDPHVDENQVNQCAQKWTDRKFPETCMDERPVPADVYQVLKKNLKIIKKRTLLNYKKNCREAQIDSFYLKTTRSRFLSNTYSWYKTLTSKEERRKARDKLSSIISKEKRKLRTEWEKEKRKIGMILKNAVMTGLLVRPDKDSYKHYIPCHENVKRNKREK